ncbi:hypothetical protein [Muribaculum intestinale]|uniref:hypothetical protein n=1 Tax=Muribaculum intestinale TaxID=1796646 RepID=UPI002603705D|nr:hypothetical protein [Muribaculum intestinale]
MSLFKFDIKGRWQGFTANWRKRNWVTDVFLYGIQIAAILYSLVMVAEIIDMICDFRSPYPYGLYEEMTIGGLIFRMLSKGWLVGLGVCVIVFFSNRRVLKWKLDGILWMFILFFGISITTSAVENEMFLYFSVFSLGPLAIYFLSLFLPKRIREANKTTFQQCRKPSNWLITLSFIILIMWILLLCDAISRF